MPYLEHLTPSPIHIDENGLLGKLWFRYNAQENYLVISFKYERKDHIPAPVIVYVDVFRKRYKYVLFNIDRCNRIVKTVMFRPKKYKVLDGIRFHSIWPLVYRSDKNDNSTIDNFSKIR